MLFIILAIIVFALGIWLSECFSSYVGAFLGWFLACCTLLICPVISRSPYFYDLEKSTDKLIAFSDKIYYQNNEKEGNLSFCLVDNDSATHIETIHYESLNIEYSEDISTAEITIETYKIKPKYKWLIYDVMSGKIANVNLCLPESYNIK